MTPPWYVVTGGPSTGKTTVINLLAKRGYKTTIEEARHYLSIEQSQGISPEVARENNRVFQGNILTLPIQLEASLNPAEIVFLDRALPDELAYYTYLGLEPDKKLVTALEHSHYRKVFILDLLPLKHDGVRAITQNYFCNGRCVMSGENLSSETVFDKGWDIATMIKVCMGEQECVNRFCRYWKFFIVM